MTGTDEDVIQSALYAIEHGKPGGGYIFSFSNCIFNGIAPERYQLMLQLADLHFCLNFGNSSQKSLIVML